MVQVVIKLDHMMSSQRPNTKTKKKLKVSEARRIWEEQEVNPNSNPNPNPKGESGKSKRCNDPCKVPVAYSEGQRAVDRETDERGHVGEGSNRICGAGVMDICL